MFQGTLESNLAEGAGIVRAYNALGYDAVAIGNHEFDYGPVGPRATAEKPGDDPHGALEARASEARFPFLAANVIDTATRAPVSWPNVRPTAIIEKAGIKIGLIGVTSEDTPRTTIAANFAGLQVASIRDTLVQRAAGLRAQERDRRRGAHARGRRCSKPDRPDALDARSPAGDQDGADGWPPGTVDALVAGHTHQAMAHVVNGVPVIESYAQGRAFRTHRLDDRSSNEEGRRGPHSSARGDRG
jgi:5'-nucleotidase